MKTTTNHGFKKPDGTDTVNIEDLNYNADKLDALLVPATTTANGLMSKDDKTKLNGIAAGANNYTHPAMHPASMISGLQKVATSGSYNDLQNKPSAFPPSSHTHTKSQITDFPTSLPANGGNADTVGGISASDLMRMSQGQTITGTKEFISQSVGADFSNAAIQVRETQSVGGNDRTVEYAPSIGFHWSNTGAGSIAMHSDGSFHFRAQGYTSSNNVYRNVVANDYLLADGTSLKSIASQSPIKSIQRGVHGGGTGNVTISISAVNASKSIVILNNSVTDANDQYNYVPVLVSLSSTNFVVSKSAYASSATQFSWQVIEFN